MSPRRQNVLAAVGVLGCFLLAAVMLASAALGAGMLTP